MEWIRGNKDSLIWIFKQYSWIVVINMKTSKQKKKKEEITNWFPNKKNKYGKIPKPLRLFWLTLREHLLCAMCCFKCCTFINSIFLMFIPI